MATKPPTSDDFSPSWRLQQLPWRFRSSPTWSTKVTLETKPSASWRSDRQVRGVFYVSCGSTIVSLGFMDDLRIFMKHSLGLCVFFRHVYFGNRLTSHVVSWKHVKSCNSLSCNQVIFRWLTRSSWSSMMSLRGRYTFPCGTKRVCIGYDMIWYDMIWYEMRWDEMRCVHNWIQNFGWTYFSLLNASKWFTFYWKWTHVGLYFIAYTGIIFTKFQTTLTYQAGPKFSYCHLHLRI